MNKPYLTLILFIAALVAPSLRADEAKKSRAPEQAAMMPSINLTPKQELVKFVPCATENDCYRALQESDVELAQGPKSEEGIALVAEFVDGPQKGIKIFRRKN